MTIFGKITTLIAGIGFLVVPGAFPADIATRQFEVVSVKPADPFSPHGPRRVEATLLQMTDTLKNLIQFAFGVERYQVVGGPDTLLSKQFQIAARTQSPASPDEMRQMLAKTLSDRFRLTIRNSSQQMEVYILAVIGKNSKLKLAKEGTPRDGRGAIQITATGVVTRGATMNLFAQFLETQLGRPVLNETRLADAYDIRMKYEAASLANTSQSSSGSIFAGLHDLGLKLSSKRRAMPVIIIDHVETPSAD